MCVYSMVLDHYLPLIPNPIITQPFPGEVSTGGFTIGNFQIISQNEIEAIRKLIAEFREALEAAKIVDRLTKQPDCEDPEKKKLEERVAVLEQQIAQLLQARKDSEQK